MRYVVTPSAFAKSSQPTNPESQVPVKVIATTVPSDLRPTVWAQLAAIATISLQSFRLHWMN